ncbi:telomeric repeat-binding factor 1-like isoform X2 [Vombatus ursinus]|uniref:telomeric repeat-binding factor 1-like isoform X2 n=1 Tax=Vombatus ursinus TaxID=29139 RepID=UPI000FFD546D|nr:telomeric repeat-binding factor 1-like isoform X2 [Vombatus ursinus]XP_027733346.1 telomeric repeat-binding factor 1-like isoform X2 [Vombatus ursinus]
MAPKSSRERAYIRAMKRQFIPCEEGEEDEPVPYTVDPAADSLACGWMLDFFCLNLCQAFCEDDIEEFKRNRNIAEAIIHGLSKLTAHHLRTIYVCQFLTRIVEGKTLDAQFESDARLTPLESALMIWNKIRKEKEALHDQIHDLLEIQAVAVCMEKASYKEAEGVFERIYGDTEDDTPLKMKLLMIINKKDPYHPFFQRFTYKCMIDRVKIYANQVLTEKSSSFLMKAALKVVESKKDEEIFGPFVESSSSETENSEKQNAKLESPASSTSVTRSHQTLLSLSQNKLENTQQDSDETRIKIRSQGSKRITQSLKNSSKSTKNHIITTKDSNKNKANSETNTSERPRRWKRRNKILIFGKVRVLLLYFPKTKDLIFFRKSMVLSRRGVRMKTGN